MSKFLHSGLFKAVQYCFASSRLACLAIILSTILCSFIPIINTIVLAKWIDDMTLVFEGNLSINVLYGNLVFIAVLMLLIQLQPHINELMFARLKLSIGKNFLPRIINDTSMLRYEHIENPQSRELLIRVFEEPEEQITNLFQYECNILGNGIQMLNTLILLFANVWYAAVIVLFISIPNIMLSIKGGKKTYDSYRSTSMDIMKYTAYDEILVGQKAVHERVLFGYSNKIHELWKTLYRHVQSIDLRTRLKWDLMICGTKGTILIMAYAIIVVLMLNTFSGNLSFGQLVSFSYAVLSLESVISWGISRNVNLLMEKKCYLDDLAVFSNLSKIRSVEKDYDEEIMSIELQNINFRYPNTEKCVLNNISLVLEKGKHYAFVGSNGSGKTTLVKLLLGLYDNYGGKIIIKTVEGIDSSIDKYTSYFSVVHQDFAKYPLSLFENISLGNIQLRNDPDRINKTLTILSTLGLETLVNQIGLYAPLGKLNDTGIDISEGQWQKIAMARAFARSASCYILDEPTAALDPMIENEIYQNYSELTKDKTTIFISHRLASTKLADVIYVLDAGTIVETGSHDVLMKNNGLYKKMYDMQRSWYCEKES